MFWQCVLMERKMRRRMALERKRSLFVSAYVVVFVLFFAAIFYYGWKERERTVREKDIVSEHKDTKERAMPENGKENSSALEHEETGADTMGDMQQEQAVVSLEDARIGKDTLYRLEIYDIHTQKLTVQEGEMPPGFLGMTREELEKYWADYARDLPVTEFEKGFLSCELTAFSKERVTVRKTYEGSGLKYRYYMVLQQGTLSIYYSDKKTPYEHTDITEEDLPPEEIKKLTEGIYVEDEEELYSMLESYTS